MDCSSSSSLAVGIGSEGSGRGEGIVAKIGTFIGRWNEEKAVVVHGRASWKDLPLELKDQIVQACDLPSTIQILGSTDLRRIMAPIYIDRASCLSNEVQFFKSVAFEFGVVDFDFSLVRGFITSRRNHIRSALRQNKSLIINLHFTTGEFNDELHDRFMEWLDICKNLANLYRTAHTNGTRMPFNYRANADDFFAHLEIEPQIGRMQYPGEIETKEAHLIKTAMLNAPVQFDPNSHYDPDSEGDEDVEAREG